MKAAELKKLIAEIPDNEEVYYGHYDIYCEEWDHKDDFKPEELYFKNGIKFWLINGGQPQDSLEKSEYDKTIEWQSIIKSFPSKNGWTIDDRTYYSSRAIVAFQAGGFEFKIAFWRGKNKLIKTSLCQDQEFDSWDEFFAVAVPAAKRAAQKLSETHWKPRKPIAGYRFFSCEECGSLWKEKSRDCHSPSDEICPYCGELNHPNDSESHPEWPIDKSGNLI